MVRGLGQLESAVMERMWSGRPRAAVREMLADLRQDREIAYTTVMTVMDALHRKGLLRRQAVGRAYVYEVAASKEAYTAELMRDVLAGGGDRAATFVHFVERLTAEESAALDAALRTHAPRDRQA
jgi:predicted transcriptional regulator